MSGLIESVVRLPKAVIAVILVAVAGALCALVRVLTGEWGTALISAGIFLAVVGLPLAAYLAYLRVRDRSRGKGMEGVLIQELGRKFFEGVDRFKKSDRDLYSAPWYVMVGEPGAGKTEAIRHANVCRSGENDPRQGTGGTVNMDWWFAKGAVLLDTAGRLMFEASTEWREFLRLLKRHRAGCPINGMVLAIPANSLLFDTADNLSEKATQIAQQFDAVQRELGVRFPVYVVITKSDLIPGFREYFNGLSDPASVNQMLGWSNPDPLDQPFQPDLVDRYLETVRQRLKRRRLTLLLEPKTVDERSPRRIDQVDALYTFPDNLRRIESRLRQYLETIFMPSEWSMKPLFVRGIYFTSSMGEGQVLDLELAEAAGVPPTEVKTRMQVWARDRSFFLKDFFLEKVFAERGLVTGAANVSKQIKHRRIAITAGALSAAALILIGAGVGYLQLQRSIGPHYALWKQAYKSSGENTTPDAANIDADRIRLIGLDQSPPFHVSEDAKKFNQEALKRFQTGELKTPVGFYVFKKGLGDVTADSQAAHRAVFRLGVLEPLVRATAVKLAQPSTAWNNDAAVDAFRQLKSIAALSDGQAAKKPDLDSLARFALAREALSQLYEAAGIDQAAGDKLNSVADRFYPPGEFGPGDVWKDLFHEKQGNRSLTSRFGQLLEQDADSLAAFQEKEVVNRLDQIKNLIERLRAYRAGEEAFLKTTEARLHGSADGLAIKTPDQYSQFVQEWNAGVGRLEQPRQGLEEALRSPKEDPIGNKLRQKQLPEWYEDIRQSSGRLVGLIDELAADVNPGGSLSKRLNDQLKLRSGELKQRSAALFADIDGRIKPEEMATLHRAVLGTPPATASADPSSLPPGGAKWNFEAGLDAYQKTSQLLRQTDVNVASRLVRASDFENLDGLIDQASPPDAIPAAANVGRASGDRSGAAVRDALTARQWARRGVAWRQVLDQFAAVWKRELEALPAERLPDLAFTALRGESVPGKYVPQAAADFAGRWRTVSGQWTNSRSSLLDDGSLAAQVAGQDKVISKFKDEFEDYWANKIAARVVPSFGTWTWADFQLELKNFGDSASDDLARIYHQLDEAQRRIEAFHGRSGATVTPWKIAEDSLRPSKSRERYDGIVSGWRKLGENPAQARAALLRLSAKEFEDLFEAPATNVPAANPAQDYWSRVAYQALELLKAASPDVRNGLLKQVATRSSFPLRQPGPHAELKPADVELVKGLLDLIDPASDVKNAPQLADKDPRRAALQQIRDGGEHPDPEVNAWIENLKQITDKLTSGPITYTVSLVDERDANKGTKLRSIRFDVLNGRQVKAGQRTNLPPPVGAAVLGTASLPGDGVKFEFFEHAGAAQPNPAAGIAWNGQWSALRALFAPQYKVTRVQSPGGKDTAAVYQMTLIGEPENVRIQLKFDKDLPDLRVWPKDVPGALAKWVPAAAPTQTSPAPTKTPPPGPGGGSGANRR